MPCRAEDVVSGRWEGTARIPDNELTVVVDLAQENGAWTGSIIIPGLGLKGVPLTDIKVQSPDVNFAVKGTLGIQLKLRLDANNRLTGNFEQAGDVVHASPALADGVLFFGSWDSYFYAVDVTTGKEKWRFHGGEDPTMHNQVGFQSSPAVVNGTVYTGCRDSNLYALDAATGKEKWRFFNDQSWVITSPAVADGKVFFATSDSSLYHVVDANSGKPIVRQQGKAFVFSSPSVAGDVVFLGVLNGTLEARDAKTGDLLWDFQVEKSKQNNAWVLTGDRKFNVPFLYHSNWREAPLVATDQEIRIGGIYSSPLVVNGVVYFGSADGFLYALE
ncbi:MAG: PQQ-binding-like beta-propeller repeat protein [Candidatus Udaeobacter sp.]